MNEWIDSSSSECDVEEDQQFKFKEHFYFLLWQGFIKSTLPLLFTLAGMKREQGSN